MNDCHEPHSQAQAFPEADWYA